MSPLCKISTPIAVERSLSKKSLSSIVPSSVLTRNCEILSSGFNSRGLICPFLYIVVVGKILLRFLKFQSMSLPLTVHQISSAGIELICLMVSSTVGLTEISADKGVHKNMAKTKKAKDFLNLFKRTPIYFRISG